MWKQSNEGACVCAAILEIRNDLMPGIAGSPICKRRGFKKLCPWPGIPLSRPWERQHFTPWLLLPMWMRGNYKLPILLWIPGCFAIGFQDTSLPATLQFASRMGLEWKRWAQCRCAKGRTHVSFLDCAQGDHLSAFFLCKEPENVFNVEDGFQSVVSGNMWLSTKLSSKDCTELKVV